MKHNPFYIKAVLFDFDGTLTKPGALDLSVIKKKVGCPADMPYLAFVETLDYEHKQSAMAELEKFELDAAAHSQPNENAEDIILYLRSKVPKIGIISNNNGKRARPARLNDNGN